MMLVMFVILTCLFLKFEVGFSQCDSKDSSALLQFKSTFQVLESPNRKTDSWIAGTDCCSWDGVECQSNVNSNDSRVIGLDLNSSGLFGNIDSTSSLFELVGLQKLNLAYNDFNFSRIPRSFANLSLLTHLNLSGSLFSGQVPAEISRLSGLVSLDLSDNYWSDELSLELKNPDLKSLVQNLMRLENLNLRNVNVSSPIPELLANVSSLKSLIFTGCSLYGEFPIGIFRLPNLEFLYVPQNPNLSGYLPEFPGSNSLKGLWIQDTNFSGEIPASIGNLNSLELLDLSSNKFSGSIPRSIGNLTRLSDLQLSSNDFVGQMPSTLANLTELRAVSLSYNNFSRGTLSWLSDGHKKLEYVNLIRTNLFGEIPSSLGKMTQLVRLSLFGNQFTGQMPRFLFNLTRLNFLDLGENQLTGGWYPSALANSTDLQYLNLHSNQISGPIPAFSANFSKLSVLILASNKLTGTIPSWIMNLTEIRCIRLESNRLEGTVPNAVSELRSLEFLNLGDNLFKGSLPDPPATLVYYSIGNNQITGEIPPSICNPSSLQILDLSNNKLRGQIPGCLGNFSSSLSVLNLERNDLTGRIPTAWTKNSSLKMLSLGQNKLDGAIPRSLAECSKLEKIDLGSNRLKDTFPIWLGNLQELKLLILRSNLLHGRVDGCESNSTFPLLRIIDLSSNSLSGDLPTYCFQTWNAMKAVDTSENLEYMQSNTSYYITGRDIPSVYSNFKWDFFYNYSMTITNKGTNRDYERIIVTFTAIDLSNNRFQGNIPRIIGNLKGIQMLNLSNNGLSGQIPPSIANLTRLESLDLSNNALSGKIPEQLSQVTSIAILNLSYNNLTGSIPQRNQFATYDNGSFVGNPGLCGRPLSKGCDTGESPPSPVEDGDSGIKFGWKSIVTGYGSGAIVGLISGHFLFNMKRRWFLKNFGWKIKRRRREW